MSTATAAIVVLALLVISATLWIAFSYRRDLAASRARVRRGSRVLKTRCGQIEIGETGVGTPLIVVHGAGGGFDQGLSLGRQLAARGFRVVAPSRFGYLRTPLPPIASPAAQADAHGCLLDSLGIAQAAIIGVSAGAPSALQFAIRHPERCTGLVLVVPLAYKPPSQPSAASRPSRWRDRLLNIIVGADFPFWLVSRFARDTAIRMVLATPPQLVRAASPIEQGRVASLLTNILPLSQRAAGLSNDDRIARTMAREELERVRAPTLIMSCRDDLFGTFAAAQYTAQHIPGARFIGFERGGHVWVGHHEAVLAEIAALLHR